jgi:CubicO group peptidase (beta-lactamase class C family)
MKPDFRKSIWLTVFFLILLGLIVPAPGQDSVKSTKKIAAVLQPYVDSQSIAGAVTLVADKDNFLSLDAAGYADVGTKMPILLEALFWIASQSKPITAVALMMLVDEGKVNLDDPVEKYLPEFKAVALADGKKPKHAITVREILSHTSGLEPKSAKETPTLDTLPLRDACASYAVTPLLFEPGTQYKYSNAGINTAGRIVEVVSGMPYEKFLDERLFIPLGMKDTTFWPNAEQVKRLAKSYRAGKKKTGLEETTIAQLRYPLDDRSNRYPMPAGGLFSTASDVGRFCQMMLGGGVYKGKRYLSEAAVKEMTKRQTPKTLKESYGLGWSVKGDGFGHGGAYKTNMNIDTKRGLITVFMVQQSGEFPNNGKQCSPAFRKAAEESFAK